MSINSRFSDRTYSQRSHMKSPERKVIHINLDTTEFNKHNHPAANLQYYSRKVVRILIEVLRPSCFPAPNGLTGPGCSSLGAPATPDFG